MCTIHASVRVVPVRSALSHGDLRNLRLLKFIIIIITNVLCVWCPCFMLCSVYIGQYQKENTVDLVCFVCRADILTWLNHFPKSMEFLQKLLCKIFFPLPWNLNMCTPAAHVILGFSSHRGWRSCRMRSGFAHIYIQRATSNVSLTKTPWSRRTQSEKLAASHSVVTPPTPVV